MELISQIFLGGLAVAAGTAAVKWNYQLANFTGSIGFVEKYLGAGSTYAFFKMLGVAVIIGGFLYMTGLHTPVLDWLLAPVASFFRPFGEQ